MHEQAGLNIADDPASKPVETALVGVPTVEYDRSTLEMIVHLEEAEQAICDLKILVSIWPEDIAMVNEHTRRIANAMGQAYAARDRFLAYHHFLSGLPAVDPS